MAGTFGGAYYAPLYFHLLPYVEQKAVWESAVWLDYKGAVGQLNPNPASTIQIPWIWPTWDSVERGSMTWLRQTRIPVYQCPSDYTLGNGLDWMPGDSSYAGNFQVFGSQRALASYNPADWDANARMPATFQDGTSNTLLLAEKLSRCDGGTGIHGGTWWMRGVYHGYQVTGKLSPGSSDSFPGDRFSAVFGGGKGQDNTQWLSGAAAMFLVRPRTFIGTGTSSECDKRVASSPHSGGISVAMADASVRFVSVGVDATTWGYALTPSGSEVLGNNW